MPQRTQPRPKGNAALVIAAGQYVEINRLGRSAPGERMQHPAKRHTENPAGTSFREVVRRQARLQFLADAINTSEDPLKILPCGAVEYLRLCRCWASMMGWLPVTRRWHGGYPFLGRLADLRRIAGEDRPALGRPSAATQATILPATGAPSKVSAAPRPRGVMSPADPVARPQSCGLATCHCCRRGYNEVRQLDLGLTKRSRRWKTATFSAHKATAGRLPHGSLLVNPRARAVTGLPAG